MTLGYLESVEVQTEEICLAAMKICGRTNINNCINFMNNKMQAANHFRYYDDLINYAFMDKQTMSQVYDRRRETKQILRTKHIFI